MFELQSWSIVLGKFRFDDQHNIRSTTPIRIFLRV